MFSSLFLIIFSLSFSLLPLTFALPAHLNLSEAESETNLIPTEMNFWHPHLNWLLNHLTHHLIIWPFDHLTFWPSNHLILWPSDYLTIWSSDHLTIWLSDCLTIRPSAHLNAIHPTRWISDLKQHPTTSSVQANVSFQSYQMHSCFVMFP